MNSNPSIVINNKQLFEEVIRFLDEGYSVTLRAQGESMFPSIKGGIDVVELQKKEVVNVRDIVLARISQDVYVLHRINAIAGGLITLRGDANGRKTETCSLRDICGVVHTVIRHDIRVDPYSLKEQFKLRFWFFLRPLHRYILGFYRRRKIFQENRNNRNR